MEPFISTLTNSHTSWSENVFILWQIATDVSQILTKFLAPQSSSIHPSTPLNSWVLTHVKCVTESLTAFGWTKMETITLHIWLKSESGVCFLADLNQPFIFTFGSPHKFNIITKNIPFVDKDMQTNTESFLIPFFCLQTPCIKKDTFSNIKTQLFFLNLYK